MEDLTLHAAIDTDSLLKLDQQEVCLIPLLGMSSSGMRVLTRPETHIGRQTGVDIIVRDPKVSRRHAKILMTESGPIIVDAGSRNGTFVNDRKIERAPLKDGDLIRVGDTVFRLRYVNRLEVERQEELYRQATRDGLTRVHTRQYLLERLDEELARARRHHFPMSFLMIDLDNLKAVNDRKGHPAGDEALTSVARMLRENLRWEDILARYGGDEFAILAPFADISGARVLAERLRTLVEQNDWSKEGGGMSLTVSIGTATFPDDADSAADLVHKADVALYRAKRKGRNCIVSYSPNGDDTER